MASSHTPQAPEWDKEPDLNYRPAERQSDNRTDPVSPSGPMNIPVHGGARDFFAGVGVPPRQQSRRPVQRNLGRTTDQRLSPVITT